MNFCFSLSIALVFLQRLLTPNGRLLDLVLTGKESKEGREEVLEIEKVLKKRKVLKK